MENEKKIYEGLRSMGVSVFTYREIDSTNTEAKRYALSGGSVPALFVADTQSAGRGRMGRKFYSPDESGIYLSLLIKPKDEANTVAMTTAAAVAAHDAIFEILGIETGIKWVNDLYLNEKKIAGILAESFFGGSERFVVVGIGINLWEREFPEELVNIAGALLPKESEQRLGRELKVRLAAAVGEHLFAVLSNLGDKTVIERYRRASLVLGKKVTFTENGESFSGVAQSIEDTGALSVRLDSGEIHRLASGEISLRLDKNKC